MNSDEAALPATFFSIQATALTAAHQVAAAERDFQRVKMIVPMWQVDLSADSAETSTDNLHPDGGPQA
jgi:hypothetical protein